LSDDGKGYDALKKQTAIKDPSMVLFSGYKTTT
jgi:hypothetical protein